MSSALLIFLVTTCVVADGPWWATAVIYHIYPLSFKDSKGNGFGDIRGILEKLDYLKEIGVTAIWLSPIYKSPKYDWGYDVSDYKEIDPLFGTMDDFDELMAETNRQGIYLIMDFVPNHTSELHPWFQKSLDREEPYTDYYVWKDSKGVDEKGTPIPPNNWMDRGFTGSSWQWSEKRKQFYLHQYLEQQPDLNFRNPLVAAEMTEVLKFWLDKGVDGFRMDSVPFLFEDKEFRDEVVTDDNGKRLGWWKIDHIYTQNLPETYDYLLEWGKIFEEYIRKDGVKRVMFLEVYNTLNRTMTYYMGPSIDGDPQFMVPFNFNLIRNINQSSRASDYKTAIMDWISHMPEGAVASWVLGNHDHSRVATRLGPVFSDAINMIASILPGIHFMYFGEEIGMEDTFVSFEEARDNLYKGNGPTFYFKEGRDSMRTPMQWDDSISAGFSNHSFTWLPVNPNFWRINVAAQKTAARSHLQLVQRLARARSSHTLRRGTTEVEVLCVSILVIARKLEGHDSYILMVNTGSYSESVDLSRVGVEHGATASIFLASLNFDMTQQEERLMGKDLLWLRSKAAVLLRVESQEERPEASDTPVQIKRSKNVMLSGTCQSVKSVT